MTTLPELRARYFQLMQRSVQIGAQFPDADDIDLDNPGDLADVTMLLREFNKCQDEMIDLATEIGQCNK